MGHERRKPPFKQGGISWLSSIKIYRSLICIIDGTTCFCVLEPKKVFYYVCKWYIWYFSLLIHIIDVTLTYLTTIMNPWDLEYRYLRSKHQIFFRSDAFVSELKIRSLSKFYCFHRISSQGFSLITFMSHFLRPRRPLGGFAKIALSYAWFQN